MSKIIKKAVTKPKTVNVGDQVNFIHWIPLQNIGMTTETLSGQVVKVNRVTVQIQCDQDGNVWSARMDELVDQAKHNTYIHGIKLNDMIMKLLVVLAGVIGILAVAVILAFGIVILMTIVDDKLN